MLATSTVLLASITTAAVAAEAPYKVHFDVQIGTGTSSSFVVEVHPEWSPIGAARFKELVTAEPSFFTGVRFFRVISGFMAQFGISGSPSVAAEWRVKKIKDDPKGVKSNGRGYVSFATSGADSRTTQMFINFSDNSNLDGMGFTPFARVIEGMDSCVDKLYSGYGEGGAGDGKDGRGPSQGRLQSEGNKYLKRTFPKMSYITSVRVVSDDAEL
jgi:peptidyl-prolyl cis-trans isomerase A (cyclophilin A)